jgi:hypothetical protein
MGQIVMLRVRAWAAARAVVTHASPRGAPWRRTQAAWPRCPAAGPPPGDGRSPAGQVFNPADEFTPGRAACPARPEHDSAGGGWRGCC